MAVSIPPILTVRCALPKRRSSPAERTALATSSRSQNACTEMRGAALLTEKGDELMQTGVYSQRQVSPQFAQGYEKGLSDAAKRDYWSMQEAQRWAHQ